MGWRDLIVTSQPREETPAASHNRGFEYFEDFESRYEKQNSLSIVHSLQNSTPPKTSSISSKPPIQAIARTEPTHPLQPGWLVVYRDAAGRLRGGFDERDCGTVAGCSWTGSAWTVVLTSGDSLSLGKITAVAKTDATGGIVAAWETPHCGIDGEARR